MNIAVSACLLGTPCRYDGQARPCDAVRALRGAHTLVPICPEVLGGLRIPHPASEVVASERALRVASAEGADVTDAFLKGAQKALAAAQEGKCQLAVLKAKSPSCGNGRIYDGTFTGTLVPGYGVAARLLRANGIRVLDEEQLAACLAATARREGREGAGAGAGAPEGALAGHGADVDVDAGAAAAGASGARHDGGAPASHVPPVLAASSAECPVLQTGRLVLRPLRSDDIDDVFAYCSDPDVGSDAGWPPHRTREDSRVFVEEIGAAPHVFGIFEKRRPADAAGQNPAPAAGQDAAAAASAAHTLATGPCIGSVGLIPDPQRRNVDCLMLGYALAKPAWGKGYMTEAAREVLRYGFEELGLGLVSCTHYTFNARSGRVIGKCGFRPEGTLRAAEATPDGLLQDMALYSLTAGEWRSRQGGLAG